MRMVGTLAFLFALLGTTTAWSAERPAIDMHEAARPVPPIAFADEDGNRLTLDDWRGKVVLLNVWATWCGPCRTEMPTLDRLQAELGGEQFEVVALSIDRAGVGVVRKFYDETGIEHLRIVIDETMKTARALEIFGLPGTLLIGPDGMELGRHIGPAEWDTPEMIAFFKSVIAENANKDPKP